jgi:hypothetical protein
LVFWRGFYGWDSISKFYFYFYDADSKASLENVAADGGHGNFKTSQVSVLNHLRGIAPKQANEIYEKSTFTQFASINRSNSGLNNGKI